jgi:hypothetical protein
VRGRILRGTMSMQTELALGVTTPLAVADGEFATTDIYFAATLVALGMELRGLDRTNPQRVRFVFIDDDERPEWRRLYFSGRLRLDPLILMNSLKALKHALYGHDLT